MLCKIGAQTIFSAIFALRVFESVSETCNMLLQQIVALKIVRADVTRPMLQDICFILFWYKERLLDKRRLLDRGIY